MLMKSKGQGTIEYLIIIAIVVVIALVVVSLLLDVTSNTASMSVTTARAAWQTNEPWGIVEWSLDGETDALTIVLKNNSFETLGFNSIVLDGDTGIDINNTATTVPPGGTLIRIVNLDTDYSTGDNYTIRDEDILIDYNSGKITNRTQFGAASIVGTSQ